MDGRFEGRDEKGARCDAVCTSGLQVISILHKREGGGECDSDAWRGERKGMHSTHQILHPHPVEKGSVKIHTHTPTHKNSTG